MCLLSVRNICLSHTHFHVTATHLLLVPPPQNCALIPALARVAYFQISGFIVHIGTWQLLK